MRFILGVALSSVHLCCRARSPHAEILASGIFKHALGTGAPPYELVQETKEVQACLGAVFGMEVRVEGLTPGKEFSFRKQVRFPRMLKSDGSHSTGYEISENGTAKQDGTLHSFQGFAFDHDYEQVVGEWTIEFKLGQQVLASAAYTVVPCALGRS